MMPGNAKEAAMDAVTNVPPPVNEPIRQYPPGSPDRAALESKVKELTGDRTQLTMTIGGRERTGRGEPIDVVAPHNYRHVLGTMHNATEEDVADAIDAAPPTCSAGHGGRLSTRQRSLASPSRCIRPRSTPPAS